MNNKVAENPFKNRNSFIVVTALFVTLYVVSNVMAVKVIGLWDLFYFDAGTITFPFAYMLGDVLTEIWGYKTARKVIFTTLVCNIVMVLCTQIGVFLPSPDYLDATAQAYNTMFSYVPRIVIASLTGFLLGELSNAWLMEKITKEMQRLLLNQLQKVVNPCSSWELVPQQVVPSSWKTESLYVTRTTMLL